jgi:hypothetical protein
LADEIENSQLLPTLIKTIISALRNNSKAIILNSRIMDPTYIEDITRRHEDMTQFYLRVVKTIFYERTSAASE